MADGIELASAYVTLVPSLKGAAKSIDSQLSGIDLSRSGARMGASLSSAMGKSIRTDALKPLLASVRSAEREVDRSYRRMANASGEVEVAQRRLSEAVAKYGGDSSQAAQAQLDLERAQQRLSDAAGAAEAAHTRLADAQEAVAAASAGLGDDLDAQSRRLATLSERAEAAGRSLESIGSGLSGAGKSIAGVGDRLTAGVTVPLAGAAAAAGAFALRTASAAETTEISFTTMLGSEEAALSMMEELADFAAHTPFELSGLQTATRQLLAYGFTAGDVIPMLTAVGDATAALGTGQAGIESVTRALGQMQTRGKVSAEEMLQLTEAGIPAWEYLARAIGTDTAGAMEKVTDGAVSASEGIAAITAGMREDFGGMMEEQSRTVEGLFSNLTDAIERPLMKLRESDAYERFAESLSGVVDAAGPFVESLLPHMESGLDAVSGVLDAATDAMEGFSSMSEESQAQVLGLVAAAAGVGPAMSVGGRAMERVGDATRAAGKALPSLSKSLTSLGETFGWSSGESTALGTALSAIPGPAKLAAAAVGVVLLSGVASYVDWATKADREARVQAEAMDVLAGASETAGAAMSQASDGPRLLGTEIYNLGEDIQENWQSIADLGSAFDEIDAKASAQVTQLSAARTAIADYNGQTDLSAQQLGSFQAAIETLNERCGTNYEVVKDAGGAYCVMRDGAKVAADELYELIDAQMAQAQVSAQMEKLESLYAEQAEQAQEYAEAVQQVADAQAAYDEALSKYGEIGSSWALDDLNEAKASLAEVEDQMGATAEATDAVEESIGNLTAASRGAVEGFDALVQGSGSLNSFFSETGGSMDEFADDLEASGVSLEEFSAMGQDELLRLAGAWDGTEQSIADSLRSMGHEVEAYNDVPLNDKDAAATIDDSSLVDAQGNLYTWDGSVLIDQHGNAVVDDVSLTDAQGNLWTWNGSSLLDKDGNAHIGGNLSTALAQAEKWRSLPHNLGSKVASITTSITNVTKNLVSTVFSRNAAGGIRLNAAGGIRAHADGGVIATRAVPLDIVGEDGAEAIVPLTNRRYSQPFADLIAEGVAREAGRGGDTYQVYVDGSAIAVDGRIAQALSALLGAVERRYDMGGAVA
ncbi:MAG: tape measure protein [Atopobiaceae bacterium]|nr:tape measure protein [Atopobiaceae bacterium]